MTNRSRTAVASPPFSCLGSREKTAPMTVAIPIAHANGIVAANPHARRCGFMMPNQTQASAPQAGRHRISGSSAVMNVTMMMSRIAQPQRTDQPGSVGLQPLLQHHQDPHHLAVVARVFLELARKEIVNQGRLDQSAFDEAPQRFVRKRTKGRIRHEPGSDRQAEPVLLLRNDLRRQEVRKRFLEEVSKLKSADFVVRARAWSKSRPAHPRATDSRRPAPRGASCQRPWAGRCLQA